MQPAAPPMPLPYGRFFFACFCILAFTTVFSHAWVTEDAYITFRVVDNFLNGEGLRWNIDERVQVYTHPLWMLLHIPAAALTGNIYLASITISAACGLAAVLLLCRVSQAPRWRLAALAILPLMLSPTFSDFVVSGLENPLTYLLLAWFALELLALEKQGACERLVLVAALLLLTRLDNIALVAPGLSWALWTRRQGIRPAKLLLAASPLLLWCVFSLLYYGFLFPNTKYAKLDSGIDAATLAVHGLHYIEDYFYYDTVAFFLIPAALGYSLYKNNPFRAAPPSSPSMASFLLAAGGALHIVYVVLIGGDFMSGRFFASAFFMALIVMQLDLRNLRPRILGIGALAALALSLLNGSVLQSQSPYYRGPYRIMMENERRAFAPTNGLFSQKGSLLRREPDHHWTVKGRALREAPQVVELRGIGMMPFYAGRNLTVIDVFALADPLMARLPVSPGARWRIGHFIRDIPDGYLYARETGKLDKMDNMLALYYAHLRLVTSGPLWSLERLKTIAGFQLGWYDGWRYDYITRKGLVSH